MTKCNTQDGPLDFGDIAIQLRVAGGLIAHAEARDYARACGIAIETLFTRDILAELAAAAIDEREPRISPTRAEEREFYEVFAHIFTPADAAWTIDLFRLLAASRASEALPATLRWAADALENQWTAPAAVRAKVAAALASIEGDS